MSKFVDRTGQRYGKLTVVERTQGNGKGVYWRCRCDCGNEVIVQSNNLHSGHTTSCGCARVEFGKSLLQDLTDMKFGRLTVLSLAEKSRTGETRWVCRCDCGKETIVQANNLKSGLVKSCGCARHEKLVEMHTIHGERGTRLYNIWAKMRDRCHDKSNMTYGGRGITICPEWDDSYTAFRNWALNNGYSDKLTIDRIDNDKGYFPENCRWVDAKAQARNRRSNRLYTYNGETLIAKEWEERYGLPRGRLRERIETLGWPIERALTEPIHRGRWL